MPLFALHGARSAPQRTGASIRRAVAGHPLKAVAVQPAQATGAHLRLERGNVVTFFTSFEAKVPLEWAVIGLVFCSTVGVVFGLLPAIRASRLHPIDASRYE
jgi:ABC-type antimicrobial peptide transport system permease subunit